MDFASRQRLFEKPVVQPKKTVEQIKEDVKFLQQCIAAEGKLLENGKQLGKNKS